MQRELTHAETIVETNAQGVQLCRPKYGANWTIVTPMGGGQNCCHWIGGELEIRAQWNANYADEDETPREHNDGANVYDDGDDIEEDDHQPSEYDEWQDYMGGDDWDHGQYDDCGW